jgi:hypothetical protein
MSPGDQANIGENTHLDLRFTPAQHSFSQFPQLSSCMRLQYNRLSAVLDHETIRNMNNFKR